MRTRIDYNKLASEMKRNIVGFIPARGGSKEIPDKNIVPIAGYPLIAHTILSLKVVGVEKVYVSTDSKRIANIALSYGADIIDRPSQYSTDESPTEDAITHFLSLVDCDAVAFRQCTSPMLEPHYIKKAINEFIVDGYDSLFTVTKRNDMLFWSRNDKPINYNPKYRERRQTMANYLYIETGGMYLFKKSSYLRYRNRICGKYKLFPIPYIQSFEIDDEKDLNMIRRLIER